MGIRKIDVEKVAKAIEADVGEALPDLRQALAEAKAGVGRVTTPEQIIVRQAREKSGLTQAAFAERIETPVATLRDWEQGRFAPPGGVLCLLRLIIKHPELSEELSVV
ncbi:helix-turn-helix domain-containing protein [Herbaspirillum sp. WGmk3]|uniref:helix-turn-helix domain-containing protein n=1 Tax=Herbaspirillum sp. WGmk3 TaxID=2919925 RepID=UPI0020906EC0|nr:helix-turn-helix domain-containing protein [Herbaspirillum sp. WGmk3]MCO4856634.1 helix-turn-helix domain-containing protein [Herbaspirillum sp. WGmk3]